MFQKGGTARKNIAVKGVLKPAGGRSRIVGYNGPQKPIRLSAANHASASLMLSNAIVLGLLCACHVADCWRDYHA
jgi:hypothetical protein